MSYQRIKEFLDSGGDPNFDLYNFSGDTPLTSIIKSSNENPQEALDAVKLLLNAGADPDRCNKKGEFPLYCAAVENKWHIGKLLLAYQANQNRTYQGDKLGNIAFSYEKSQGKKINRHERLSTILPHAGLFNKKINHSTQKELLFLSRALGYKTKKSGVCHAVAMMTIQAAMIEGGLETFQERFKRIYSHSVEKQVECINAAKKKRSELYSAAKEKYSKQYVNVLDANKQANIETYANLTNEEKIDLDIATFFDAIEIHQKSGNKKVNPFLIKRKFFENNDNNLFHQRDAAIVSPINLDNDLAYVARASGIYTNEEIEKYFVSLRAVLKKYYQESGQDKNPKTFVPPLAMYIGGANHGIAAAYDFRNDGWLFANVNDFSSDSKYHIPVVRHISTESVLANNIADALFSDSKSIVGFSAAFYTTSNEVMPMYECINEWKRTSEYKKLHAITLEHAKRQTRQKKFWADIANKDTDTDTLKQLENIYPDPHMFASLLAMGLASFTGAMIMFGMAIPLPIAIPILLPLGCSMLAVSVGSLSWIARACWLKNKNVKKAEYEPEIANPAEEYMRCDDESDSAMLTSTSVIQNVYKPSSISMFAKQSKSESLLQHKFSELSVTDKRGFLNEYLAASNIKKVFVLKKQDKADKSEIKERIKEHEDDVRFSGARLR